MASIRESKLVLHEEQATRQSYIETTNKFITDILKNLKEGKIDLAVKATKEAFEIDSHHLIDLIHRIRELSISLIASNQPDFQDLALDCIHLAIQLLNPQDKEQKELIAKYKTEAAHVIHIRMPKDRRLEEGLRSIYVSNLIGTGKTYLLLHYIIIQPHEPGFDLNSYLGIFDTAYKLQNKVIINAFLLILRRSVIDNELEPVWRSGRHPEFGLQCMQELNASLKSAAYILKLHPKTKGAPFFQEFPVTCTDGKLETRAIPKDLKKTIALLAVDPNREFDEDFLLKKITETNTNETKLKPEDSPESAKKAFEVMGKFITEKKGELAASSIFSMINNAMSQPTLTDMDHVVTLAIRDFRLEFGRGKDGAFNSILPKEVKSLQVLLKSILSEMFGENDIDRTTAFIVRNYLCQLGQNKQYPEQTKLKNGLKIFVSDFDTKVRHICEQAAEMFSDKNKVKLLDKTIHTLCLKVAVKFASKEYFEKLTDRQVIDHCAVHLSDLLCKKLGEAKAWCVKHKFVPTIQSPIDPHSERDNPELHVAKFIKDSELLDVVRKSVASEPSGADLSPEVLKVLM